MAYSAELKAKRIVWVDGLPLDWMAQKVKDHLTMMGFQGIVGVWVMSRTIELPSGKRFTIPRGDALLRFETVELEEEFSSLFQLSGEIQITLSSWLRLRQENKQQIANAVQFLGNGGTMKVEDDMEEDIHGLANYQTRINEEAFLPAVGSSAKITSSFVVSEDQQRANRGPSLSNLAPCSVPMNNEESGVVANHDDVQYQLFEYYPSSSRILKGETFHPWLTSIRPSSVNPVSPHPYSFFISSHFDVRAIINFIAEAERAGDTGASRSLKRAIQAGDERQIPVKNVIGGPEGRRAIVDAGVIQHGNERGGGGSGNLVPIDEDDEDAWDLGPVGQPAVVGLVFSQTNLLDIPSPIKISGVRYGQSATELRRILREMFGRVNYIRVFSKSLTGTKVGSSDLHLRVPQGEAVVVFHTILAERACLSSNENAADHVGITLKFSKMTSESLLQTVKLDLSVETVVKSQIPVSERGSFNEERDRLILLQQDDLMINQEIFHASAGYEFTTRDKYLFDVQSSWILQQL